MVAYYSKGLAGLTVFSPVTNTAVDARIYVKEIKLVFTDLQQICRTCKFFGKKFKVFVEGKFLAIRYYENHYKKIF